MSDYQQLPGNLPVPQDDGAAAHVPGAAMPSLVLRDTSGNEVALDQRSWPPGSACRFPSSRTPIWRSLTRSAYRPSRPAGNGCSRG